MTRINSIIGSDMNRLFGMENVSLKKSEIYVNKKKGANCSFRLNSTSKWLLGNFIINQFKNDDTKVFKTN